MFIKYPKIYAIGKEEVEGIFDEGEVVVQEKIDGANTSIWSENGEIKCGSRNNDVTEKQDGFRGFVDYVKSHKGIKKLLENCPNYRLYGEWLVQHTVHYNQESYGKFYLYDILLGDAFLLPSRIEEICKKYKIEKPETFCRGKVSSESVKKYVGKSVLGENGEGIVIKNMSFINKFGVLTYGKIVTPSFKENNGVKFGGNDKYADNYWEHYIVNKYATKARVEKMMQKIQNDVEQAIHKEQTPRVANSCYHDMLTEDIWDISKKVQKIDFQVLKRIALKKFISLYHEILDS